MPQYQICQSQRKSLHCVFFFGSYDYGWLPEADLKPYQEFKIKSEVSTTKKSVKKAMAIDEIEAYRFPKKWKV